MTSTRWALARSGAFLVAAGALVAGSTQLTGQWVIGSGTATGPSLGAAGVTPVGQTLLSCPGPETAGIAGLAAVPADPTTILVASAPAEAMTGIAAVSAPGGLTLRGQPANTVLATAGHRGDHLSGSLTEASTGEVEATGALAVGVAAAQVGLRKEGDERGLQSAPCQVPRSELWLLAGGGSATRRERLVVANAGANPVTVDVQVHGASGPIASVNGTRIAVPAHGRISLLVDAIAAGEASPAVHVTATGGLVTAVLEDSWIDGATGRGRDDASPSEPPGNEQVIPAAILSGPATLRILVPGGDEAVVQSRALGTAGAVPLPTDPVVRIPGGTVRDIDLTGLPAGAYAVQVRSDRPVVASVLVERRPATGQSDLAWISSAPAIPVLAGSPVPTGFAARLAVVGTGEPWAATVVVVGADGAVTTTTAQAAADTGWVGDIPSGARSVWVRPSQGSVRAGLLVESTDPAGPLVTATPLLPLPVTSTTVPVREVRH